MTPGRFSLGRRALLPRPDRPNDDWPGCIGRAPAAHPKMTDTAIALIKVWIDQMQDAAEIGVSSGRERLPASSSGRSSLPR